MNHVCSARRFLVASLAMVLIAAAGPISAPWLESDIGSPTQAGSSTYDPVTGVWAVNGGGGDIWDNADHFHFVYQPLSGDCTLTARVLTQQNTNVWAKAGVMIRETTAAGSSHAFMAITPGNGAVMQGRASTGGASSWPGGTGSVVAPYWVRLTRAGNVFTGTSSADGVTWNANVTFNVTMAAATQVGLAVTAHDDSQLCACTFDNFTIYDGTGANVWPLTPPTNLTSTNGVNSVTLNWTASTSPLATGYAVYRGPNGGPYTALPGGTTAGTTFTDTTAAYPNTYGYVVVATGTPGQSVYSNQATGVPLPYPITATPNTGLQTNENGASTQFTITLNQDLLAGNTITFTVASSDAGEGEVSGNGQPVGAPHAPSIGFTLTGPLSAGYAIPITVTGIADNQIDTDQPYQVTIAATSTQGSFSGLTIPPVNITNMNTDTPGITVSKTSGLVTTESGGQDGFTISLHTAPFGTVTINLTMSAPGEASLSTNVVQLDGTNWNTGVPVIVTGLDDALLDFTMPWTITATVSAPNDAPYDGFPMSSVTGVNLDNEAIPALKPVWGGSSGGGGCGLTGLEAVALLGLLAAARRRQR